MRDIRTGGNSLAQQVKQWNAQPDDVRIRRAGVRAGVPFTESAVRKRLPFKLPSSSRVYEDGTIELRAKPHPRDDALRAALNPRPKRPR
jgi:hypothetical protein